MVRQLLRQCGNWLCIPPDIPLVHSGTLVHWYTRTTRHTSDLQLVHITVPVCVILHLFVKSPAKVFSKGCCLCAIYMDGHLGSWQYIYGCLMCCVCSVCISSLVAEMCPLCVFCIVYHAPPVACVLCTVCGCRELWARLQAAGQRNPGV